MHLTIELDREEDGRAIADVVDLPGVMAYGATEDEAVGAAQALALEVLADDIREGRRDALTLMTVEFETDRRAA